jgi:hypothetical protein
VLHPEVQAQRDRLFREITQLQEQFFRSPDKKIRDVLRGAIARKTLKMRELEKQVLTKDEEERLERQISAALKAPRPVVVETKTDRKIRLTIEATLQLEKEKLGSITLHQIASRARVVSSATLERWMKVGHPCALEIKEILGDRLDIQRIKVPPVWLDTPSPHNRHKESHEKAIAAAKKLALLGCRVTCNQLALQAGLTSATVSRWVAKQSPTGKEIMDILGDCLDLSRIGTNGVRNLNASASTNDIAI